MPPTHEETTSSTRPTAILAPLRRSTKRPKARQSVKDVTTLTAPTNTSSSSSSSGSSTTMDDDDDRSVWVGRTDGSLILVRLGTEYVARFESKLALEPSADNKDSLSVSVQSKLVRDDAWPPTNEDDDDKRVSDDDPFEILCQRQAYNNQPIQHVVATAHNVFTVAAGASDIDAWLIPETTARNNKDDDTFGLVGQPTLTGVHQAPLVGLHAVSMVEDAVTTTTEPTLLTSVSEDGILALWDMSTGTLLFTCHLMNDDQEEEENSDMGSAVRITSATAAHGHWFLGRSDGKIIGYPIATLVEASADGGPCPLPAVEWTGNQEQTAITATLHGTDYLV